MPAYDATRFDPPAPTAAVIIRNPDTGAMVHDVLMLVDTGADITLLPRAEVEAAGIALLADARYELMGFDGSRTTAAALTGDMVFLGRAYRGRYLITEEACGILGRDVLNHVALVMDGPRREWSQHR